MSELGDEVTRQDAASVSWDAVLAQRAAIAVLPEDVRRLIQDFLSRRIQTEEVLQLGVTKNWRGAEKPYVVRGWYLFRSADEGGGQTPLVALTEDGQVLARGLYWSPIWNSWSQLVDHPVGAYLKPDALFEPLRSALATLLRNARG